MMVLRPLLRLKIKIDLSQRELLFIKVLWLLISITDQKQIILNVLPLVDEIDLVVLVAIVASNECCLILPEISLFCLVQISVQALAYHLGGN